MRCDATRRPKRDIITTFKKMMVVFRAALICAAVATRLCQLGARSSAITLANASRRVASSASPGTALPIYLSIFNARQTLMDKLTPLHPLPLPSVCASCNENAICLSCHNAGHTNRVSCVKHPLCGRVCLLNVTVIWRFSSCFSLSAPSLTIIFVCLQQLRACVMALLTTTPSSFATCLPVRVTMYEYVLDMYNYTAYFCFQAKKLQLNFLARFSRYLLIALPSNASFAPINEPLGRFHCQHYQHQHQQQHYQRGMQRVYFGRVLA